MATLPADEDYAQSLLTIFSAHDLRPGMTIGAREAIVEFLSRNLGRAPDYHAAVEYSQSRGWLRQEFGRLRLTGGGYAEM